jgi:redox-sensitive bicupin YhaK (pirin superfamily)
MRARRLAIYDREIEIAQLHIDERSGAEHYLIRYPQGLRARPHTHTAAHTMVVLEGALEANGQKLEAFSYCHFPAGEVMIHQPADGESALFVLIFDGPFDVHPADN